MVGRKEKQSTEDSEVQLEYPFPSRSFPFKILMRIFQNEKAKNADVSYHADAESIKADIVHTPSSFIYDQEIM